MKSLSIILILFLSFNCLAQMKIQTWWTSDCDSRVNYIIKLYNDLLNVYDESKKDNDILKAAIVELKEEKNNLEIIVDEQYLTINQLRQQLIQQTKLAEITEKKVKKKNWFYRINALFIIGLTAYQMGKN